VICAKMAEPIDLSFGLWTWMGLRMHKFNHIRQVAPMIPHVRARCRYLSNTVEPSACGSDAALCQITCYCLLSVPVYEENMTLCDVYVMHLLLCAAQK